MNSENKARGLTLGAQVLPPEQVASSDLGALAPLVGTWINIPVPDEAVSAGWNTISVPGADRGFVFEVIPYTETLTFRPAVVQAGNRGPVVNGEQVEQLIFGLLYEQKIDSVCTSEFCRQRGFPAGSTIHVETGLFLNVGSPDGGLYNCPDVYDPSRERIAGNGKFTGGCCARNRIFRSGLFGTDAPERR